MPIGPEQQQQTVHEDRKSSRTTNTHEDLSLLTIALSIPFERTTGPYPDLLCGRDNDPIFSAQERV